MGKTQEDINEELDQEIKNKKRKPFWPILLLLFLFLVSIFPVFEEISFNVNVQRNRIEQVPYTITRNVTSKYPIESEICENISFAYSTSAGNVNSIGKDVKPNLIVINMEEKWGEFTVNFSYIDEEKFPFEIYGGEHLIEKYEKGEISEEDADFYSEDFVWNFGPAERVLFNDPTPKKDKTKSYWGIANIYPPEYEQCRTIINYINKTVEKNFTEHKKVTKEYTIKEYTSLKEILNLSFSQWFVIIFMFILILYLIIRIKQLYFSDQHD